jgi:hypothetical protein
VAGSHSLPDSGWLALGLFDQSSLLFRPQTGSCTSMSSLTTPRPWTRTLRYGYGPPARKGAQPCPNCVPIRECLRCFPSMWCAAVFPITLLWPIDFSLLVLHSAAPNAGANPGFYRNCQGLRSARMSTHVPSPLRTPVIMTCHDPLAVRIISRNQSSMSNVASTGSDSPGVGAGHIQRVRPARD